MYLEGIVIVNMFILFTCAQVQEQVRNVRHVVKGINNIAFDLTGTRE